MEYLLFAAAFACGFLLCFAGYLISKRIILQKGVDLYSAFSFVRQLFSIVYLVAVYFSSQKMGWNLYGMLISGALGVTLPNFYFAAKLLKLTQKEKGKTEAGDDNG